MMMKRFPISGFILAGMLVLAGPAAACQLAGSEWRPVTIGGEDPLADMKLFVRFGEDGRVSGNAGCNGFGGTYKLDHDRIEISRLMSTMMACPKPVMKRERQFLRALKEARRCQRHQTQLVLRDGAGERLAELIERH